jgi:diguanylate cyclase (GGDEF)-like protein
MGKFNEFVDNSKGLIFTIGAFLTVAIGVLDYYTGHELGLSLFYLVPLFVISWFVGRLAGVLTALVAAGSWSGAHILAGMKYSEPFIAYWNFGLRLGLFLIISIMTSRLKVALGKEKILAKKDFLTDIANWQSFHDIAKREIDRSKRYTRPITAAYIDCDNFKKLNDSKGHKAGDDLLKNMAKAIEGNIRSIDMVARVGGDEFIVLFPETDREGARIVVNRLNHILVDNAKKNKWEITYTIGVATVTAPPESVDEMVSKTDNVMYLAKKEGKNVTKHEVFG